MITIFIVFLLISRAIIKKFATANLVALGVLISFKLQEYKSWPSQMLEPLALTLN